VNADSSNCSTCDAMSTNRGWEGENRGRGTVMVPGGDGIPPALVGFCMRWGGEGAEFTILNGLLYLTRGWYVGAVPRHRRQKYGNKITLNTRYSYEFN